MAVSGLPEPCRCHARCIARLALDMMDLAADEVQIDGEPVVSLYIFFYAPALRLSIFMFASARMIILYGKRLSSSYFQFYDIN